MLSNYAPWGDLEACRRRVALTNYFEVKMGKINLEFFRTSTHYHINAWSEKDDMDNHVIYSYAP